ncbi:MAG: glycosyltransferase family 4 protein [Proteobacteria bacterium]|nr:glycosyltransferase family 4 protein [Pseudomonadota bacterium]
MTNQQAPKKVLLSTDAVGGIWSYTIELARAFSRRRVEVEIAVLGPTATTTQAATVAELPLVRLHQLGVALDWTAQEPSDLAIASNALASLAQHLAVDTIQLHTPALVAQSIWHAPVLAVVHSCVGTWWRAVRQGPPPEDFQWRMATMKAGLASAHALLAPSHAFADMVRETYSLPVSPAVVHNARANVTGEMRDGSARHGVLTAGRLWDEGKNVVVLERAASMMPSVPIMAAGATEGPHGATIQLERLRLLGMLDEGDMGAALAGARVFASPALYEPFGLGVLEAAQSGLPLVLADIATFRELWDGAAIFLPPRDAEIWGATLAALHADPVGCRRWGMKARARSASYTVERFDGAMWEKHCQLLQASATHTSAAA